VGGCYALPLCALSFPAAGIIGSRAAASRTPCGRRCAANAASLSQGAGCQPVRVTFGLRPGWCPVSMAELL